jgi:protein SCO1
MSCRFQEIIMLMVAAVFAFTTAACDRLSVKDDLNDVQFELTDHRGDQITFPDSFQGKSVLIGYVYTHCPDICPMITFNMRDVEQELDRDDLHFVSISFDPNRDTPEILADYARNYRLNDDKWSLLTGDRNTISDLLDRLNIATVKTPSRFTESGQQIYFIDHTDRVTLIDSQGKIRRHYTGSELRSDEVISDIRQLLEID